jgi:pilus assembly protein CpaF
MVDARLPDGSRVNAIIPPLSLVGPVITIRKFSKNPLTTDDLVTFGTLTPDMVAFLKACVESRLNIIVSGGTGSGKTTLLNILSSFIPSDERIVTIEDSAELQLRQDHVVTLESRPANVEGKGRVSIRDLVINALRMRPERIVVGECRGAEALDMLQAMNTGHDGSMTTAHANSPRDVLSRIETMCLMAGMDLPLRAIREQISKAIELIVQQSRMKDGTRKVTNITEVQGMEGDVIVMQDIFVYEQTGVDEHGKIIGRLRPTGIRPKFMEKLEAHSIFLPATVFGADRYF